MTPLVDASIASALISPNPVTYVKGKTDAKETGNGEDQVAALTADERFYTVDAEKLQKLCSDKPWMKGGDSASSSGQQQGSTSKRPTAKFFETISIGPSAVTKMMMHCQSGVEKGISNGGNPIEGKWAMMMNVF